MRSSILLILVGVFVVARTIVKDDKGQNLVDRILGLNSEATVDLSGTTATLDAIAAEVANLIATNQDPGGTNGPSQGAAQHGATTAPGGGK